MFTQLQRYVFLLSFAFHALLFTLSVSCFFPILFISPFAFYPPPCTLYPLYFIPCLSSFVFNPLPFIPCLSSCTLPIFPFNIWFPSLYFYPSPFILCLSSFALHSLCFTCCIPSFALHHYVFHYGSFTRWTSWSSCSTSRKWLAKRGATRS